MASYEGTVTTPKPIDEVFAYVANLANGEEWDPGIERSEVKRGDPLAEGGEVHLEFSGPLGRTIEMTYRTLEVERPRRTLLRAETGSLISLDQITCRELPDGGTEVTYSADLTLKGARRLADPLLNLGFQRAGKKARDGLERKLNA